MGHGNGGPVFAFFDESDGVVGSTTMPDGWGGVKSGKKWVFWVDFCLQSGFDSLT